MLDVYNLGGRHLNNEEIIYVVRKRCEDLGLNSVYIDDNEKVTSIKNVNVTFECEKCKSKTTRLSQAIFTYKLTTCKECADKRKQGRFKRKKMNKESLQGIIDTKYEDKEISFYIVENFEYINNKQIINIQCKICESLDSSRIDLLTQGRKSCKCMKYRSKLELEVKKILESHNLSFEKEKGFDDLRLIQPLRYDFGVTINNKLYLIECDGIQHFYPTFGEKSFLHTKKSDVIKDDYAKNKNIPLLRIKYDTKESIENMILKFINL